MILRNQTRFFSPDDGAGDGSASGNQPEGEKPIFTQAQLDAQIKDRLAKAQLRATDIKAKALADLGIDEAGIAEYKKYQSEKEAADQKRKEEQGQFQTIIKENQDKHANEIKKWQGTAEALQSKYHTTLIKSAVFGLAPELQIHAPEDVFQLSQKNFKVKPDETIDVVGASGEPIFDDTGKQYTVKTFLEFWLASKPWFVASTGAGGGTGISKTPAGQAYKFKRSQFKDTEFYRKNRAEITEALKNGQVLDDVTKR